MGQAREFEELATAQLPALLRAAYLLTADWGRAEDLVQTALANAYLAWHRVVASDSPEAYLRQILLNAHRRGHRRRRVRELLTAEVPDGPASPAGSDLRRDLVVAVAALPKRQRAVVVLRYFEDRPDAEVARILGCSVGTVKSQAARALATLRRHPALADSALTVEETPR